MAGAGVSSLNDSIRFDFFFVTLSNQRDAVSMSAVILVTGIFDGLARISCEWKKCILIYIYIYI